MEALDYIMEVVRPTIEEFELNPASRLHAFLACVTTFHVVDYMSEKSSRPIREEFRRVSPEFLIVDRVAHAFKHAKTDGRNPLRVDEIIERPPGIFGLAVFGLSRFDDPTGGVNTPDSPGQDLLEIVKSAASFLEEKARASQPPSN